MGLLEYVICLCMHVKKQQSEKEMEQQTGSKLGKEFFKAVLSTSNLLLNLHEELIIQNARLDETRFGIKVAWRNINNIRYANDTIHVVEHGKNYRAS